MHKDSVFDGIAKTAAEAYGDSPPRHCLSGPEADCGNWCRWGSGEYPFCRPA